MSMSRPVAAGGSPDGFPFRLRQKCHRCRLPSIRGDKDSDATDPSCYVQAMSLRCFFGVHRPLLSGIVRRPDGYATLCESCGRPLERREDGPWVASDPLYERRDHAG